MDSTCYYNVTFIEIHMAILTIYSQIDMKKRMNKSGNEEDNGQKGRYFFLGKITPD